MKVYVSKSNSASIDNVNAVKNWIQDHGHQVLEHLGGKYDPSLIRQADICIVVGPRMHDCYPIEDEIIVGKGQYEEARALASTFILSNGADPISNIETAEFQLPQGFDELSGVTSYQKFGTIYLDEVIYTLTDIFPVKGEDVQPKSNEEGIL